MAKHPEKKRPRSSARRGLRGKTGPAGAVGATGPPGPAGANHAHEIATLNAQIAQLVKELQTQLTRIGQIQVQLDELLRGVAAEPRTLRIKDQTEH